MPYTLTVEFSHYAVWLGLSVRERVVFPSGLCAVDAQRLHIARREITATKAAVHSRATRDVAYPLPSFAVAPRLAADSSTS
jgi:hypothetical protein